MGLIMPPGPCWSWEVDNLTGTPAAATPGTNFSFGGSSADGTTVQLLSSTASDAQYMVVGISGANTTAEDNSALADILWDPAGGTSWTNFVDNLVAGFSAVPAATTAISHWYHIPIWIPAGTSLAIRGRKNGGTAAGSARAVIYLFGEPKRPDMWWCGQRVEGLGITESTSKGTSHTPGNTGSYSSYATIGTSTRRYGALQLGVNGSDANASAVGYYWQIGLGSSRLPGTPTFYVAASTAEVAARSGYQGPLFVDIPASSAIQVRATCSGTAEAWNVALYGVY
jgi:hypothetical protein